MADGSVEGGRKENLRKPLSGKLHVSIHSARELEHTQVVTSWKPRASSKQVIETFVSIKVEGAQRARSHPSRTDRWNEDVEIEVEKANEVEITIYDKQISEQHPVPIGMLWIRLNDLVESLRRQKVEQESGSAGWVTAAAAGAIVDNNSLYGPSSGVSDFNNSLDMPGRGPGGAGGMYGSQQSEGVEGWFSVEPAGAIALRLNFGTQSPWFCF